MELKTVTGTHGNTGALKDGTIEPRGFTFAFEEVPVLVRAFRRMVRASEFDVCELALTTYLCARAYGKPFTAIPVFPMRGFHHDAIVCNLAAGIHEPKDLEKRRVGVNRGYTVTTGVWARGVLAQEYGVELDRVTWVRSGDEHVAEYRPPANVESIAPGGDLAGQLSSGELEAAVGLRLDDPAVAPLIPDAAEAGFEALRRRGHYPINHLVVIRDELLERRPGLAREVFQAFAEAKRLYVERLRAGAVAEPTATDTMYARVLEITGADPLPYGLEPNRGMIEELIGHAVDQKIIERAPPVETLFAQETLDLSG